MKKIILGVLALSMCLTLTGCKNEQDSAVTSLGNQLDETANTLSNFTTVNPSDINVDKDTLDKIATNASKENMYDNLINTQHALLNEEYYKTNILDKTAKIKNNLNSDLKLSKAQISALKELTTNLQRYTTSINYSKNELNNSVKAISNMKKNAEKNADKINVKLNKLACNSNVRSTYYENIINTLNQIEGYISTNSDNKIEENSNQENNNSPVCPEPNCYNNEYPENYYETKNPDINTIENQNENSQIKNTNQEQEPQQNKTNNAENKGPFGLTKNIDTYGPTNKNIDTYGGNDFGGINNENLTNGYYGNEYNYYGRNNMMNRIMNGNYYGFGYGYNSNNYNRINEPPMRPTTYVNITIPEKRLEDFEKINEETGEIEKVEDNNPSTENTTEEKTQPTALMHISHKSSKTPDAVAHKKF